MYRYFLGYSPPREREQEPVYDMYDNERGLRYRLLGNCKEYEPVITTTKGSFTRPQLEYMQKQEKGG